jgi:sigma-B regulation protein RsbU (phosphoserine phosphatase)
MGPINSRGHQINLRTVEVNSPSLLAGGRLISIRDMLRPPLLLQDREVPPIAMPKGASLGVFAGRTYQSLSLQLTPGDLLMVYTDGVTEAENTDGEPFDVQGCQGLLAEAGQARLDTLIQGLRQSLRGFTSSQHLEDDCTLQLLRRRPLAGLREGS